MKVAFKYSVVFFLCFFHLPSSLFAGQEPGTPCTVKEEDCNVGTEFTITPGPWYSDTQIELNGIATARREFCVTVGDNSLQGALNPNAGIDYDLKVGATRTYNKEKCECKSDPINELIPDVYQNGDRGATGSADWTTVDFNTIGTYNAKFKWDDYSYSCGQGEGAPPCTAGDDPPKFETVTIKVNPSEGYEPYTPITDCYFFNTITNEKLTTDTICGQAPNTSTTIEAWLNANHIAPSAGSDSDLKLTYAYPDYNCSRVTASSEVVGDNVTWTMSGEDQDISVPGEYTVIVTWANMGPDLKIADPPVVKKLTIRTFPPDGYEYSADPEPLAGELLQGGQPLLDNIVCLPVSTSPTTLDAWLSANDITTSMSDTDAKRYVSYSVNCSKNVGEWETFPDLTTKVTRDGDVDFSTTGVYTVTWKFDDDPYSDPNNEKPQDLDDAEVIAELTFVISDDPSDCENYRKDSKACLAESISNNCGCSNINSQAPGGESASGESGGGARSNPTDPVNLASGELILQETDLSIPGRGFDFRWQRVYGSQTTGGRIGNGWTSTYHQKIAVDGLARALYVGDEIVAYFLPKDTDTWFAPTLFATLKYNPSTTAYELINTDKSVMEYRPLSSAIAPGAIGKVTDRNGNLMQFVYNSLGQLITITDTLGRNISVTYTGGGHVSTVTDFSGRTVQYAYYTGSEAGGSANDLKSVTTPAVTGTPNGNDFTSGKTTEYTYSKGFSDAKLNHNLLTIKDAKGQTYLQNTYSTTTNPNLADYDTVVAQRWGYTGEVVTLSYTNVTPNNSNNQASFKTIVNDRVGNVQEYFYNKNNARLKKYRQYAGRSTVGTPVTETTNRPTGKLRSTDPDYVDTVYKYGTFGLLRKVTKPNGNTIEYVYQCDLDASTPRRSKGNLRFKKFKPGTHVPAGSQEKIQEEFKYDVNFGCGSCGFNFVKWHKDAKGNITEKDFDANGNTIKITYAQTGVEEEFSYNSFGQILTHTAPDNGSGHRTVTSYDYYSSGVKNGYRKSKTVDSVSGGLALKTEYDYDIRGNVTKITDPKTVDSLYTYNQLNQVMKSESGQVSSGGVRYHKYYYYDANNNVIKIDTQNVKDDGTVDSNAYLTTEFTYDILNYPLTKTEEVSPSKNITSELQYDANRNKKLLKSGLSTSAEDPYNRLKFLYDERDNLYRIVRGDGSTSASTTQYDYDRNDNINVIREGIESFPRVTTVIYDGYDRPVQILDPMGNVTSNVYDANSNVKSNSVYGELNDVPGSANNVLLSHVDYEYDPLDRIKEATNAFFDPSTGLNIGDGTSTKRIDYTPAGNVKSTTDPNGNKTNYSYDRANRLSSITDAKGNVRSYSYDTAGNVTTLTETEVSDQVVGTKTYVNDYEYDNLGRLIKAIDPVGNSTNRRYDSRSNLTTYFDAMHTTTSLGNKVTYAFDGLNRLIGTTYYLTADGTGAGSPAGSITTTQQWDDASRLIAQFDGKNQKTSYIYDSLNRVKNVVNPDGTFHNYAYDVHGNVTEVRDPNGNIIKNYYNVNNKVTNCKIFEIIATEMYPPTTSVLTINYNWTALGQMSRSNSNSFIFDSLGNLIKETVGSGSFGGKNIVSKFDPAGNRTLINYPSGTIISNTYDPLNRIKQIKMDGNFISRYNYEGSSNRVVTRENGNNTAIFTEYNGNANGSVDFGDRLPKRIKFFNTNTNSIISEFVYSYNKNQHKDTVLDLSPSGAEGSRTAEYDSLNRMVESSWEPLGSGLVSTEYALDASGNRDTFPTNSNNQYLNSSPQWKYDANGNQKYYLPLATKPDEYTPEFQRMYNWRNQLVHEIQSTSKYNGISYDSLGRMLTRSEINWIDLDPIGLQESYEDHFYDNWQSIEENFIRYTTGRKTIVYGGEIDEALYERQVDLNGNGYPDRHLWYLQDNQMSVRVVTDENGNVVRRQNYDDYGTPTIIDSEFALDTPLAFMGRPYLTSFGLYDFRTRHYDPALGRFLQRDSIGTWGDPLNMGNAYSFVGNAPWVYTDPYGLWAAGDLADDLDDYIDNSRDSTGSFGGDLFKYGVQEAAMMAADVMRFGQGAANAYEGYDANGNKLSAIDRGLNVAQDIGRGATLAGGLGAAGSKVAVCYKNSLDKLVTVTSWADKGIVPDLNSGRWVILGEANKFNFFKTGLSGPKINMTKTFPPSFSVAKSQADFTNYITSTIPRSQLRWPSGGEFIKGFLGQRVIK